MEPISLIFGVVTMGIAHFGGSAEARYQANCWGMLSWYRCHQQNFSDIHTPAYMATLRRGRNPMLKDKTHAIPTRRHLDGLQD